MRLCSLPGFTLRGSGAVPGAPVKFGCVVRTGAWKMRAMTVFPPARAILTSLVLSLAFFTVGCAGTTNPAVPDSTAAYRVEWSASRAANGAALRSASTVVRAGQKREARTDSTRPEEDKPAFPNFTVALAPARKDGVHELYVRVGLQEVSRTRKGKLRRKKRNIGALIPIRVGETQQISSSSDPIRVDVRLERR